METKQRVGNRCRSLFYCFLWRTFSEVGLFAYRFSCGISRASLRLSFFGSLEDRLCRNVRSDLLVILRIYLHV